MKRGCRWMVLDVERLHGLSGIDCTCQVVVVLMGTLCVNRVMVVCNTPSFASL